MRTFKFRSAQEPLKASESDFRQLKALLTKEGELQVEWSFKSKRFEKQGWKRDVEAAIAFIVKQVGGLGLQISTDEPIIEERGFHGSVEKNDAHMWISAKVHVRAHESVSIGDDPFTFTINTPPEEALIRDFDPLMSELKRRYGAYTLIFQFDLPALRKRRKLIGTIGEEAIREMLEDVMRLSKVHKDYEIGFSHRTVARDKREARVVLELDPAEVMMDRNRPQVMTVWAFDDEAWKTRGLEEVLKERVTRGIAALARRYGAAWLTLALHYSEEEYEINRAEYLDALKSAFTLIGFECDVREDSYEAREFDSRRMALTFYVEAKK